MVKMSMKCDWYTAVCFLCAFLTGIVGSPNAQNEYNRPTVLVFGGNGFMGAATVEKLVQRNYDVVIVNRGNWYWDAATRIKPFVKHLKCDRMKALQKCADLQQYLWDENTPAYFDAVVDFSAYHGFEISEALELLQGKIMRYIYISSDSTYEVCDKNHTFPTREDDAVRPVDEKTREKFKRRDDYGHGKLECEEELERLLDNSNLGVPYVSLRLPDVIGPRDNTHRWWIYQLWVKLHKYLDKPLSVPDDYWNKPMSFVFVDDVADVIMDLMDCDLDLYNQAYNLAQEETPTLVQFLHSLMDELNVEDIPVVRDVTEEGFKLLPSVTWGPIDVTKAKRMLKWNPTPWMEALAVTVKFYEDAMSDERFEKTRKDVLGTLMLHFSKDSQTLHEGLFEEYGTRYPGLRDEL